MATIKSNEAINKITSNINNFLSEGIRDSYKYATNEKFGIWDAIKEGHKAAEGQISIGGYSPVKIAGSYMGISAGARIVSGGGLYKDRNGETDLIGIPIF